MKKEQSLILNINKLASFTDVKEKQKQLIKEFPFVKITDGKTYESAKRNRTGLRSGRVGVQGQEKLLATKIREFRNNIKDLALELVGITIKHEEKQQAEIDIWEEGIKKRKEEREAKKLLQQQSANKLILEITNYLAYANNLKLSEEVSKTKKDLEAIIVTRKEYGVSVDLILENIDIALKGIDVKLNELILKEQLSLKKAQDDLIAARVEYKEYFGSSEGEMGKSTLELIKLIQDDKDSKLKELEKTKEVDNPVPVADKKTVKEDVSQEGPVQKKEPEAKPLTDKEILVQTIGDTIYKECSEHIQIGGLRVFGISWEQVHIILEPHGYKTDINASQ